MYLQQQTGVCPRYTTNIFCDSTCTKTEAGEKAITDSEAAEELNVQITRERDRFYKPEARTDFLKSVAERKFIINCIRLSQMFLSFY